MTKDFLIMLIVGFILCIAAWFGITHYGASREAEGYKRATTESTAEANRAMREQQIRVDELKTKLAKVVKDASEREIILKADTDRVLDESDRLRVSLKASGDRLSSATADALRKYATTLSAVFGECSSEVEKLARAAGQHASDSLMLQQAGMAR